VVYAAYSVVVLPNHVEVVSDPAIAHARVVPDPLSVGLTVEPSATDPGAYDLSWVRPDFGRVDVYVTEHQPPTGLGDETRTAEVVETAGLDRHALVNYPVRTEGDRDVIRGFVLDPDWVRGHFVAVHRIAPEAVRVGPVHAVVRPRPPGFPLLIERVDATLVTFAWPRGVTAVHVYQGPRGHAELDPDLTEPLVSLTADEYERYGGVRLANLPSSGCTLYLCGVVFEQARPVRSEPTVVDYPGIARLWYRLEAVTAQGLTPSPEGAPEGYRLVVRSDAPLQNLPLVLVAHPSRLPLHPREGRIVHDQVVSLPPRVDTALGWLPAAPGGSAVVRLFVNQPPAECGRVAVLDPSLASLRVML